MQVLKKIRVLKEKKVAGGRQFRVLPLPIALTQSGGQGRQFRVVPPLSALVTLGLGWALVPGPSSQGRQFRVVPPDSQHTSNDGLGLFSAPLIIKNVCVSLRREHDSGKLCKYDASEDMSMI